MATILCPYCFNKFSSSEAEYQCENKERKIDGKRFCPTSPDTKYNTYWHYPKEVESGHFFRRGGLSKLFGGTVKPGKCDVCGTESRKFVCPHCHNWLPTEMIEEGSEIISIIGTPNSGKTVYFTALIHELQKYGSKFGLTVTPTNVTHKPEERTSVKYRENKIQLFDNHTLLAKTVYNEDERSIPMMFSLTTKKAGSKKGRTIYLVFYDSAGEAFDNTERINNMKYLNESSGIILLMDPFSIPKLRKDLGSVVKVPKGYESGNVDVNNIIDNLNEFTSSYKKEMSGKPVAMTFSKIDVVVDGLEEIGADYQIAGIDLETNSSIMKTGIFSQSEADQIDEGLSKACELQWDEKGLKDKLRTKYENVKMFAVSSLGGEISSYPADEPLRPYRVLDPLVWILTQMGGFDIPVE